MMNIIETQSTRNGEVAKTLWKLQDGYQIESVWVSMDHPYLCISTQAGCAKRCTFCASGKDGLFRNLTAREMTTQVESGIALHPEIDAEYCIGFMGMGEPLENLSALSDAIDIIDSSRLPVRQIGISTIGTIQLLNTLGRHMNSIFNLRGRSGDFLQISLHASNDEVRRTIMPGVGSSRIRDVIDLATQLGNSAGITIQVNYMLIRGVNDNTEDAHGLASLLAGKDVSVKISSYCQNEDINALSPSPPERASYFHKVLAGHGLQCSVFSSRGMEIEAGCGQLSGSYRE